MSRPTQTSLSPEYEELARQQTRLTELEAQLADRELELASLRADLLHFQTVYLKTLGRRYGVLYELRAKIAEAHARQHVDRQDIRDQATQARALAQESAHAARTGNAEAPPGNPSQPHEKPVQSESLRKLYRQAAKLLHPDLTLDPDEKQQRHRLMGEINAAYARGDEVTMREILRDWHTSAENVPGDGPRAQLTRVIRKIAQVERRLADISAEVDQLRRSEHFKLKQQVAAAKQMGRDLLQELAEWLDRYISQAQSDLEQATRDTGL